MSRTISFHRGIVIAVYAMILVAMLAIFIAVGSFGNANPLLLAVILLIPASAITLSIAPMSPRERIAGYLAVLVASVPISVMGLLGGWGLFFLIGNVFLL